MKKQVELFTDGACRGNPGIGGWGAVLRYKTIEKTLSGVEENTTNNRMELLAAIKGLAAVKEPAKIELTTDSQYVRNGITKWIYSWQRNQWKTASKKPVKNQDLWQALLEAIKHHDIEWHWVKGHSGHRENELADQVANEAIDAFISKQ